MAETKKAPAKGKAGGIGSKKVFGVVPLPIAIIGGVGIAYLLYKKYKASQSTAASTTAAAAATPTDTGAGTGTDTGSGSGYSGGGGSGGFGGSQGGGLAATLAAIQAEIGALAPGGTTTNNNYYTSSTPTPTPTPTTTKVAPCPPGYSRAAAGVASSPCVKIPVTVSQKPVTTTPVKTGGSIPKTPTKTSPTKTYPVQVRS